MLRLALRSARAHWRRFALTSLAVVVGVSFVVGSFVLTDSLAASIDRVLEESVTKSDLVVRTASGGGGLRRAGLRGGVGGSRVGVPAELAPLVAAVPGVAAVDVSIGGPAQLLDKAGESSRFDITFVSNWPDHPEMTALRLLEGRAPSASEDVVVDSTTARDRNLRVGSTVRLGTRRGIVSARVSGIAERGGGTLGLAGTILATTAERAIELVGTEGRVDGLTVDVADGADLATVRSAIEDVAGPEVSVLDAASILDDLRDRVQSQLTSFVALLLGFAAITLFVSAFLIWNTFSVVLGQRTRELALLRAVGASGRQVATSVIGEGVLVGVVSSGVGIGGGVLLALGLERLLTGLGARLPTDVLEVAPRTVAVALVVGIGVTLVSVLGPAWRATRIPPVAAMAAATTPPPTRGRGTIVGIVALALGLLAGVRGLVWGDDSTAGDAVRSRVSWVALGGLLCFLGVSGLARLATQPVVGVLGAPFGRLGGVPARLARRNAVRNPRRTAATAAALMIGIALVATTLVLAASVKTAFGGALRDSIRAEIVVDDGGIVPFGPDLVDAAGRVDGVRDAVPLAEARAELVAGAGLGDDGSDRAGFSLAEPADLARVLDPGWRRGRAPSGPAEVAVARAFAEEHRLRVGGELVIRADAGEQRSFRITGVYERDELLDDVLAEPAAIDGLVGVESETETLLVHTDPGADVDAVARRVARAVSEVPNSTAKPADRYVEDETAALDIVLGIVNVLLLFAVLVAAIGIANTLALSVVERTREIGLLRTVGMFRRHVRRMVRIEGVLVALFGGVLGLGVGIAFGSAVSAALPSTTAQLTFPLGRLALLFAVAGGLGILAGILPARRAAKLDVLAAIAEE